VHLGSAELEALAAELQVHLGSAELEALAAELQVHLGSAELEALVLSASWPLCVLPVSGVVLAVAVRTGRHGVSLIEGPGTPRNEDTRACCLLQAALQAWLLLVPVLFLVSGLLLRRSCVALASSLSDPCPSLCAAIDSGGSASESLPLSVLP
jgi:hypothetical protein